MDAGEPAGVGSRKIGAQREDLRRASLCRRAEDDRLPVGRETRVEDRLLPERQLREGGSRLGADAHLEPPAGEIGRRDGRDEDRRGRHAEQRRAATRPVSHRPAGQPAPRAPTATRDRTRDRGPSGIAARGSSPCSGGRSARGRPGDSGSSERGPAGLPAGSPTSCPRRSLRGRRACPRASRRGSRRRRRCRFGHRPAVRGPAPAPCSRSFRGPRPARSAAARRQVRLLLRSLPGVRELGEAEVQDLQPAVPGDEQVLRLQVPVDDPLLVSRGKPVSHLQRVVDSLARREPSAREHRAQRLSFQQLADDVGRSFMSPDVVDRRDVGMVEEPRGLRLLLEPPQPVRVSGEGRRQHFDRHLAPEPGVPRALHLSHPSRAQRGEDLIGAKPAPGRDHGCPNARVFTSPLDRMSRDPGRARERHRRSHRENSDETVDRGAHRDSFPAERAIHVCCPKVGIDPRWLEEHQLSKEDREIRAAFLLTKSLKHLRNNDAAGADFIFAGDQLSEGPLLGTIESRSGSLPIRTCRRGSSRAAAPASAQGVEIPFPAQFSLEPQEGREPSPASVVAQRLVDDRRLGPAGTGLHRRFQRLFVEVEGGPHICLRMQILGHLLMHCERTPCREPLRGFQRDPSLEGTSRSPGRSRPRAARGCRRGADADRPRSFRG